MNRAAMYEATAINAATIKTGVTSLATASQQKRGENFDVRYAVIDNAMHWSLNDICDTVGVKQASRVAPRIANESKKYLKGVGGGMGLLVIDIGGVKRFLSQSQKPKAKSVMAKLEKAGREWNRLNRKDAAVRSASGLLPHVATGSLDAKTDNKELNSSLSVFQHNEFGELEVLDINGNPHFPAIECAIVLGYTKPHNAIDRHCRDSLKRGVIDNLGREQQKIFIPEGDLYRLIIRSKLPAAERFEKWVFDEVLPAVRKYGMYATPQFISQTKDNPELVMSVMRMLESEREEKLALAARLDAVEGRLEELLPKAEFAEAISSSNTLVSIGTAAKLISGAGVPIGRNGMFEWMRERGLVDENNVAKQLWIDQGYFKVRMTDVKSNGIGYPVTLATIKGLKYLVKQWTGKGENIVCGGLDSGLNIVGGSVIPEQHTPVKLELIRGGVT